MGEAEKKGTKREKCPLCMHKDREELEEALARGEISKKVVGENLGMEIDDVYAHMMDHFTSGPALINEDDKPKKLRELYNKKDIVFTTVIQFKERLDLFLKKDKYSVQETNAIVKMAEELRKLIETLAKLEGELKSEATYTVNMYVELRNIIISDVCPDCRMKIIEHLSKAEKELEVVDLTQALPAGGS